MAADGASFDQVNQNIICFSLLLATILVVFSFPGRPHRQGDDEGHARLPLPNRDELPSGNISSFPRFS